MVAVIWEDIPGYEGIYKISSDGKVKKLSFKMKYTIRPDRLKCIQIYPNGYRYVRIENKDGKKRSELIHRLLAIAFIPNPGNKPQVNHINGVKDDNRLENLEWCTQSQNMKHAINLGLLPSGENSHWSSLSNDTVSQIRAIHAQKIMTVEKLGELFKISRAHAYRIVNYERRKLG